MNMNTSKNFSEPPCFDSFIWGICGPAVLYCGSVAKTSRKTGCKHLARAWGQAHEQIGRPNLTCLCMRLGSKSERKCPPFVYFVSMICSKKIAFSSLSLTRWVFAWTWELASGLTVLILVESLGEKYGSNGLLYMDDVCGSFWTFQHPNLLNGSPCHFLSWKCMIFFDPLTHLMWALCQWFSQLRFPLLGEDWRVPAIWAEGMTATVDAVAKIKCIHGMQIAMFGLQMFTRLMLDCRSLIFPFSSNFSP